MIDCSWRLCLRKTLGAACALIAVTLFAASPLHAAELTGSVTAGATVVNLTTTGTADWEQWGLAAATAVNRKAGVATQISGLTQLGAAPAFFAADPRFNSLSWTDGTPTASKSNYTGGLYFVGLNNGYEFTVAANTTQRTLKLYLGGWNSTSQVRATLSDGSAVHYVASFGAAGTYSRVVTLTFSAAGTGETLTVRHILQAGAGNVGLQAAALTQQSGGGSSNAAPTLNPIGDKTAVAGSALTFPVTAIDLDGPLPLAMTRANSVPALPAAASYVDNGNGTGSFSWTPTNAHVGIYQVTFAATDGGGRSTQQTITLVVNPASGRGGALSGSVAGRSVLNLTTTGTADWVDWGLTTVTSVNRKAGVAAQIGALTPSGAAPGRFDNDPLWNNLSWTDGTPTVAKSNVSGGIYFVGVGNGYALSVPADATQRILSLYVGGWASTSRIEATLSDGSAPPYVATFSGADVYAHVVTIPFSAASAGETLTVRHTMQSGGGNIGVQAAALTGVGGGGPGNVAPTISTIGNKAVTVGNPLTFNVSASDPDGPSPLSLAVANSLPALPASASFVDNHDGTATFSWTPTSAQVGNYQVTFAAADGAGLAAQQAITIAVSNAAPPGSGALTGVVEPGPATANLSGEGWADWVDWGLTSATSVNRKSGVPALISDIALLGAPPARFASGLWTSLSWTDGTPTASKTNFAGGIYFLGAGNGYQINVPADTTPRTLKIHLGGLTSTSLVQATLSDGSAPPYAVTFGNASGGYRNVVTLNFRAKSAGQTLTVRHTMPSGAGNIGLQAAALPFPLNDNFNDGNFGGWTVVNQSKDPAFWQVVDGAFQELNRVESTKTFVQSYHLGTYAYLAGGFALTDYRFAVKAKYLGQGLSEDVGVMFRYKDPNNYYRLALNSRYGFTRLEKRVNGVFTPLATNSRGYLPGQELDITIELHGALILVTLNGDPLFSVVDASLPAGTVALYAQDQASFDDVVVDATGSVPRVVLSAPLAHSVDATDTIQATAEVANMPVAGHVDFILDNTRTLSDFTAPFDVTFTSVGTGDHRVAAVLRSQSGAEVARDTNSLVGRGGEYIVTTGNSLNHGIGDNYRTDNLAVAPRIISYQGFHAPLTSLLDTTSTTNGKYLVFNEGIGGDDSYITANVRISSILARHPRVDRVLIALGTIDTFEIIPSGEGCIGTACNGTFKGNMQTLIDKIRYTSYPRFNVPSGVVPVISLIPPEFTNVNPWLTGANQRIRAYNRVIRDELVDHELGPDMFTYFMPSQTTNQSSLYDDTVHPNSLAQNVMAVLWYNALNGTSPLPLPFVLGGVASIGAPQTRQNIIEVGNQLYLDETFTVTTVPTAIRDGRWIIGSNAARTSTAASTVSFSVDRPVSVYIAYDAAAGLRPAWMSGFVDTGQVVSTTNPAAPTLKLYVKSFPIGAVVLGGNLSSPAVGARANYVAIVVAN